MCRRCRGWADRVRPRSQGWHRELPCAAPAGAWGDGLAMFPYGWRRGLPCAAAAAATRIEPGPKAGAMGYRVPPLSWMPRLRESNPAPEPPLQRRRAAATRIETAPWPYRYFGRPWRKHSNLPCAAPAGAWGDGLAMLPAAGAVGYRVPRCRVCRVPAAVCRRCRGYGDGAPGPTAGAVGYRVPPLPRLRESNSAPGRPHRYRGGPRQREPKPPPGPTATAAGLGRPWRQRSPRRMPSDACS